MPTILEIINKTTSFFESKGVENAKYDAQHLIAFGLGCKRMDLYLKFDQPLTDAELAALRPLVARRGNREPLQHIVGTTGFRELDIKCDSRALIPRPDTEGIVDIVSEYSSTITNAHILDIGVGTGAIILSIAKEIPGHTYYGSDISEEALALSAENADHNELSRAVSFIQSDLFNAFDTSLKNSFHIIISNPPYIASNVITTLEPEVKEYDPALALDGGVNGLDWYTRFFSEADQYLVPGGTVILEIGFDQKKALSDIIQQSEKFELIDVRKDYSDNDRFVIAQLL